MSFLTDPADSEHAEQIADELGIDDDNENPYDDDDFVPMGVIRSRAFAAISDPYLADEAARMYPGDFIV